MIGTRAATFSLTADAFVFPSERLELIFIFWPSSKCLIDPLQSFNELSIRVQSSFDFKRSA